MGTPPCGGPSGGGPPAPRKDIPPCPPTYATRSPRPQSQPDPVLTLATTHLVTGLLLLAVAPLPPAHSAEDDHRPARRHVPSRVVRRG